MRSKLDHWREKYQTPPTRSSNAAKPTIERKASNPKPGVERKASNSRDLGKAVVNNPKGNRTKVKRNKSTQV